MINESIRLTADELVFLSDCCLSRFERSVKIESYVRIEHGVIIDQQITDSQDEAKRRFEYDPEDTVIVEPGYVNPRKGSNVFLELSAVLPEYEFLLAGGPQTKNHEPYFEQMVSEWGDESNVQITGKLNDELFHAAFIAADLVVLPYLEINNEGITHKVNQSGIFNLCATYGVPVATSDQARFRNLRLEWSCVEIFPPDDIESIADCIETSVTSEKASELRQSIRKYRNQNSLPIVARGHQDIYNSVISS